MAHSYVANNQHIVFSTAQRKPRMSEDVQPKLWAYMAGTARRLGYVVHAIGGVADHVHLLLGLPAAVSIAEATQKIKANSSRWMKQHQRAFEWQRGYGGFAVSVSNVPAVRRYVENQPEHHRKQTFEEEFLLLLKKHGIAFDLARVFD